MQKAQSANEFSPWSVEETSTQTRWWERSWVIPVGLALLAFLLYANTIDGHFFYSWDDNRYITENMLMRDLSPQGIFKMFSQFYFAAYLPVTILSYAVDYALWGMNPVGYHLQNVILNAANAALVYIFIKRLLENRGVALIAALLFTVHPLQVESVAWVAERKNLLSLFFMLLSFLSHMRSAKENAPAWALPLSWFLFMLSVLTKPVVVGAPILFMAYDYYWAHMPLKRVIIRSIAPWIIGITGAALIMIAHEDYGGIKEHRGGSLLGTAQVMLVVFWDYVVSFINPTNLNNRYYYPISIITTEAYKVWLGAAVLVFMGLFAWFQPLGKPFSRYAVLWVGVFMAPVVNIVPIAIERTDRYMYYPSIVIFALVGIIFMKLWNARNSPELRYGLTVVGLLVILPLSWITFQRNEVWANEGALWRDHLQDYPRSETGWLNLGVYYYNERDYTNAIPAFQRLLEIEPDSFKGNRFMGHIAVQQDRFADAVPFYERALQVEPNDWITNNQMGRVNFELENYADAVQYYQRALAANNTLTGAYPNLGEAALLIGNYEVAADAYRHVIEADPDNAEANSNLCAALAELQQFNDAIPFCQTSIQLEPFNGFYVGRLSHTLLLAGQPQEALTYAQEAVEISPERSLSYRVLGEAYMQLGQNTEAIAAFQQALELDPDNRRAIAGLAALQGGQ